MARGDQTLWDKIWRDSKGNIAIWQWPNKWLTGWAITTVISLLFNGTLADIFSWVAMALLLIWSLLELTKGDSYFRRALGLVVLLFTIASIIKGLH
jgi:hypothetical protein